MDDSVSPVDSDTSVTVIVALKNLVVVVVKAVTCELSSSDVDEKNSESDSASAVEEVLAVALVVPDTSRLETIYVREISSEVVSVWAKRVETVIVKALVEGSSVSNEVVPAMLVEAEVLLFQMVDASLPEVPVT